MSSENDGDSMNKRPDRTSQERQYLLSLSEEDRRKAFEEEDRRWQRSEQIKDWLKLALMVAITLAWNLIVFFLEPGLK